MFTLESTTGGSVLTKAVLDDYWDFHECFTATTGRPTTRRGGVEDTHGHYRLDEKNTGQTTT